MSNLGNSKETIEAYEIIIDIMSDGKHHAMDDLVMAIDKVIPTERVKKWGNTRGNGLRHFIKSFFIRRGDYTQYDDGWGLVGATSNGGCVEFGGFAFHDEGEAIAVSFNIHTTTYEKIKEMAQKNKLSVEKYIIKIIKERMK